MKKQPLKGYILTDWDLLVATMHHSGVARTVLSQQQHVEVAAMGDGYGAMSAEQLQQRELTWDWSHIRDSSEGAIVTMAAAVRERVQRRLLFIQQLVADNGGDAVSS